MAEHSTMCHPYIYINLNRHASLQWSEDIPWWRHQMETFPRYWPFVWGIRRSLVNSPHKGQCRGALMFALICAWTNRWVNNRDSGDLRRHCAHYDVTVIPTVRFPVTRVWETLIPDNTIRNKQRVLMHGHQGWNVRHGLCHIYMIYVYIYELFIAFVCFVVCSLL